MNNPLVSIIVPCYKQAEFLNEALQSVLEQTYQNWECIIVNDGSPDITYEIAQEWLKKDSRFKYLYQENGGLSSARNLGIANAKGTFVLPLDADDKIANNYTSIAMQAFIENPKLKLVYCKAQKFGEVNDYWELPTYSVTSIANQNMIFCSAFYRKNDWQKVNGYDTNMLYGLEDWEFWIAILKNGGEVYCLPSICFFYRIKPNSMIKQITPEKNTLLHEYVAKKHPDFFVTNYQKIISENYILQHKNRILEKNLKSKKFLLKTILKVLFK